MGKQRNEDKVELSTKLDKYRSLNIERLEIRKGKISYWIKVTNSITNSVYQLNNMQREDMEKIINCMDEMDKLASEM